MKKTIFILLILSLSLSSYSQSFRKVKPYKWMLGLYWNNVIDDGYGAKYLLDYENSWNLPVFPSAANVDIYLMKGMSLDFLASFNEYNLGKRIDKDTTLSGQFFSIDAHFKYGFGFIMNQQWFDPFFFAGVGYTGREALDPQNMLGGSFGAGFNIMLIKGLGVQFRASGNMGFISKDSNYGQAHLGLIYKFPDVVKKPKSNFIKQKYQWGFKRPNYRKPRSGRM